jgi:Tol biopolymer transport system component
MEMAMKKWEVTLATGTALMLVLASPGRTGATETARAPSGPISLASVTNAGAQGNARSEDVWQSVSADGRYIVINSRATNMIAGGVDHKAHLYVRDLVKGTTSIVDVSDSGAYGNGDSFGASISDDGRYVAFTSAATNLVPHDTATVFDVFVHDRVKNHTERVSLASNGQNGNAMSFRAEISGNGRYVAFTSLASNLVPGTTHHGSNVFVYDRVRHKLEQESLNSKGVQADADTQAPSISADGRYVSFPSQADNLDPRATDRKWNVYVRDRVRGTTTLASFGIKNMATGSAPPGAPKPQAPAKDAHGQIPTSTTITAQGSLGGTLSPDGRFVAFGSWIKSATGPSLGLFLHNMATGTTERIDVSDAGAPSNGLTFFMCSISAGGRYVAFASQASNLVPGDTNNTWDIFVHDRTLNTTRRISVSAAGAQSNGESAYPAISSDGHTVVFISAASNLIPNDTNGQMDVFRWTQ